VRRELVLWLCKQGQESRGRQAVVQDQGCKDRLPVLVDQVSRALDSQVAHQVDSLGEELLRLGSRRPGFHRVVHLQVC
jgi:hypothetical protein